MILQRVACKSRPEKGENLQNGEDAIEVPEIPWL